MIEPRALQQMAARCLPGRSTVVVEAVGHGGTTPVYRATRGQQRAFIRLAESAGERGVRIGDYCQIYPRAVLYPGTTLGNWVVVHAGAVSQYGCAR